MEQKKTVKKRSVMENGMLSPMPKVLIHGKSASVGLLASLYPWEERNVNCTCKPGYVHFKSSLWSNESSLIRAIRVDVRLWFERLSCFTLHLHLVMDRRNLILKLHRNR